MPSPEIKICGIRDAAALDAVIDAHADYIGLNFFARSPRYVSPREAGELAARAEGRIGRVGLFVDAPDAEIAEALHAARLDALQLHGQESPERAAQLRKQFGLPVWKVVSVASAADIARADAYTGAADFILFDAKTPRGTLPGGMGLAFDWTLLSGWKGALPWGLAGGLTPENVAEAARIAGAPLVDAASGVESAPGVKDTGRIAAFVRAARG